MLTNNLKLWIEFKNKKKKQKKKLQARDILSCGSEVVSSYGTAAMLRLSPWMSGMVLSGLRHTANLCGKQGGRVTEEGVERSVMFFNSPSHFSSADLFERSGSPHQLVDHVDGDPHEGREADDVSHCDAPVGVLIVEQREGWRFQEGADYDILRTAGRR